MKVYSPKQITKFMELGNRLWALIPSNNSFFEDYNEAAKKLSLMIKLKSCLIKCSLRSLRKTEGQAG